MDVSDEEIDVFVNQFLGMRFVSELVQYIWFKKPFEDAARDLVVAVGQTATQQGVIQLVKSSVLGLSSTQAMPILWCTGAAVFGNL